MKLNRKNRSQNYCIEKKEKIEKQNQNFRRFIKIEHENASINFEAKIERGGKQYT